MTAAISRARRLASNDPITDAASLTSAYTEIGKAFQAANPDARVKLNFAASSTLVPTGARACIRIWPESTDGKKSRPRNG